ncbi:MAG: hypothetical protein V3S89_04290 [Desulfobacterales bacterium]
MRKVDVIGVGMTKFTTPKARKLAQHNERAVFRDLLTTEEVMASPH